MKACSTVYVLLGSIKLVNDKGKVRNVVKENNKLSEPTRTCDSHGKLPKIDSKKLVDLK